jgi:hypothetical protein
MDEHQGQTQNRKKNASGTEVPLNEIICSVS